MSGSRNSPENKKRKALEIEKLQIPPTPLALQWLNSYIEQNRHLNNPKNRHRFPRGTKWVFEHNQTPVSKNLLSKKVEEENQNFILYDNGEKKKIITIKRLADKRAAAALKFLHNGEKVPLFLLKEDNKDFIETPHGNIPIVSADRYRQLIRSGKLPQEATVDEPVFIPRVSPFLPKDPSVFASPDLTLFSQSQPAKAVDAVKEAASSMRVVRKP